eukprot:XP_001706951.1 Hypothetical protein GL50803_39345 [Giardia lamblia ATCC 50803]
MGLQERRFWDQVWVYYDLKDFSKRVRHPIKKLFLHQCNNCRSVVLVEVARAKLDRLRGLNVEEHLARKCITP